MACRKAADRAMMQLSGWMERQREEADARYDVFLAEQRQIWTPTDVFDQCCVKWLADGGEVGHHDPARSGCSGGCGKDHPRIVLDWQQVNESSCADGWFGATATLSHELDPFVLYFDKLCEEGMATKVNSGNNCRRSYYRLKGFLPAHRQRLLSYDGFGSHLVKVPNLDALAASQRAHERQLEHEELERASKKRKVLGPAAETDLFESALNVCYQHSLQDHLDLAEIAWMRMSGCPTLVKYAAKMASSRLQQVRLSYTVLVDGMHRIANQEYNYRDIIRVQGPCKENLLDRHYRGIDDLDTYGRYGVSYDLYNLQASKLALSCDCFDRSNQRTTGSGLPSFVPTVTTETNDGNRFHWESAPLNLDPNPSLVQAYSENFDFDYVGHMIRVYIHPDSLYKNSIGGIKCSAQSHNQHTSNGQLIEIARCRIDPRGLREGIHTTRQGLSYEVDSSTETKIPINADNVDGDEKGDDHTHGDGGFVQYRGSFRVRSFEFDFGDLLGIYVRKKLQHEKDSMDMTKRNRPLKRSEKDYVKALAKAARAAPGSAAAFDGMQGW